MTKAHAQQVLARMMADPVFVAMLSPHGQQLSVPAIEYAVTPYYQPPAGDEQMWCFVWPNGFNQVVALVEMMVSFAPGLWPVRLAMEYMDWQNGHRPPMIGDEPITWKD